jgi:Ca-activated chloride channel family protein
VNPCGVRGWHRLPALAALALGLVLGLAACDKVPSSAPAAADGTAPSAAGLAPFSILAGSELKDLEPALTATARGAGIDLKISYAGTLDIV